MERRAILLGAGGTLSTITAGCIGGREDPEGRKSTETTTTIDPSRIRRFTAILLDDSPNDAAVTEWNEDLDSVSVLDRLAERATDDDTDYLRGQTAEIEYRLVELGRVADGEAIEAVEILDELPYYDNIDEGYPTGWYIEHPDQLLVVRYEVLD